MSELDRLADDYWDSRLRSAPSWAHLIGEYRYADRFDDVSRAGEVSAAAATRIGARPSSSPRWSARSPATSTAESVAAPAVPTNGTFGQTY